MFKQCSNECSFKVQNAAMKVIIYDSFVSMSSGYIGSGTGRCIFSSDNTNSGVSSS